MHVLHDCTVTIACINIHTHVYTRIQYNSVTFNPVWLYVSSNRLQVIYQVGVFISRSSASIYHFKQFWILAILQVPIIILSW